MSVAGLLGQLQMAGPGLLLNHTDLLLILWFTHPLDEIVKGRLPLSRLGPGRLGHWGLVAAAVSGCPCGHFSCHSKAGMSAASGQTQYTGTVFGSGWGIALIA